jgi:hypothetical protein
MNESDLDVGITVRSFPLESIFDDDASTGSVLDAESPDGPDSDDPLVIACDSPGNRRKGLLVAATEPENNNDPLASSEVFGLGGGKAGDCVCAVGVPGNEIGPGRFKGGGPIGESIDVDLRINPVDCTPPIPRPNPVLIFKGVATPGVSGAVA